MVRRTLLFTLYLLSSFPPISRCSIDEKKILELAVPTPKLSIFETNGGSTSPCTDQILITHESNYNISSIMKLAVCLHNHHLFIQAYETYQYIRTGFPDYAFVLVNMALIHMIEGDVVKAINLLDVYFEEVGGLFSTSSFISDRDALSNGPTCSHHSKFKADCVYALNIFGIAYFQQGNNSFSQTLYKKAISLAEETDSSVGCIYSNLGDLLSNIDDHEGAAYYFLKSFWFNIKKGGINPGPLIRRAILVPSISSSIEDALNIQRRFDQRILDITKIIQYGGTAIQDDSSDLFSMSTNASSSEAIKVLPSMSTTFENWSSYVQFPHFYFHYYGFHDRWSNERVANMYKKVSVPGLQKSHIRLDSSEFSTERKKKRLVFVSCFFAGDEPHGLLIIDVLKRLPRNIFEFYAIGIGPKRPSFEFIESLSNYYHAGNDSNRASHVLSSLEPDCVIFMEHVNNGIMQFLLFQRYAPIQILCMGAPVTSGISSIDYFISGDRLEHPFRTQITGDQQIYEPYTEQVVLFDGQAISFPKHQFFPRQDDKLAAGEAVTISALGAINITHKEGSFGIPIDSKPIYMCFQSLFKLHPIFDYIITKILIADRQGIIVLQAARDIAKTERVVKRLRTVVSKILCTTESPIPCKEASSVLSRIIFIPRVTSDKLFDLLQKASVILHPFPFDGSKTASDVFNASVPLITYPQEYLRGRMAQNFYITMALDEIDEDVSATTCCIASDPSDYIAKALRIAQDVNYRKKVIKALTARKDRIYDDHQVSYEWARFLCRVLGVKISAESLAQTMNYSAQYWQQDHFVDSEMLQLQQNWKRSSAIDFFLRRRILI